MFAIQLWFWVAVTSAAALVVLTSAIHVHRYNGHVLTPHVAEQETIAEHSRSSFRVGAMVVNALRAVKHRRLITNR